MIGHYIHIVPNRIYFYHRPPHYGAGTEFGGFWRNLSWSRDGRIIDTTMRDFVGFNSIPWC